MTVPMVSVVMSVFNGERFLHEAVDSILRQSFCDLEFIIIDDGSTDKSGFILDGYQESDPRVRVFHQENRGLIASLNRGCALASGKYIARMDADDIALNDRLIRQVEWMEKHPHHGVLGGTVERIDAAGNSLGLDSHPSENHLIREALAESCAISHPTALIRRESFLSVGGYRSVAVDAEDYDLWLRIADHFELANLPAVVLKYRIHSGSVSVRKRNQQVLSVLGARASASSRMNGKPDPLDSVSEITPAVLERLGVSEAVQGAALARFYLASIRNMCNVGDDSSALMALDTLHSRYFRYAENWVKADAYLFEAQMVWKHGKFAKGISRAIRAFVTRPLILGRPAKLLLRRVRLALARETRVSPEPPEGTTLASCANDPIVMAEPR